MTRDILDELDEKAVRATARPWTAEYRYVGCADNEADLSELEMARQSGLGGNIVESPEPDRGQLDAVDLAFIVSLVNAYPQLAARLRAAEAVCEVAQEFLHDFCHEKTCTPGALQRVLEAWRRARSGGGGE